MLNNYFLPVRRLAALFGLAAAGGLGGCAVYVPTVPSTPLVQKNEAEITAGFRGLSSVEATAAWSPASHIFFNAEGSYRGYNSTRTVNSITTESYEYHRQASFGVGAYTVTKTPQPLYLAAVAGFGLAGVDMHPVELFGSDARVQANYRRYYGQVYLASQDKNFNWGLSVRGTWVDYTDLVQDGNPLRIRSSWFAEPHVFARFGSGPLQGYATLGLSMPVTRGVQPVGIGNGVFTPTSMLAGVGVVFRPQFLKRADK